MSRWLERLQLIILQGNLTTFSEYNDRKFFLSSNAPFTRWIIGWVLDRIFHLNYLLLQLQKTTKFNTI